MTKVDLKLADAIQFSRLLLQFQDVVRVVDLPRGGARENDVEHSYHLAMMAWYLNSVGHLGYDVDRFIRYALVHDLAEAYAGDVSAYDTEGRRGKDEREAAALKRIRQELPGAQDMIDHVHAYEAKADPEALYIYALDKIMPMLMIYIEGGRTWREEGLSLDRLHEHKVDKVILAEPINALYQQLKELLDQQPNLFGE